MKSSSLTHEAIALRAQEIWNARGHPHGADDAIWLEAERQLAAEANESPDDFVEEPRASFDPFGQRSATSGGKEASPGAPAPAADPLEVAAKAAAQKHAASAPQLPTHNAPRSAAPVSGKPLWDKPHSS